MPHTSEASSREMKWCFLFFNHCFRLLPSSDLIESQLIPFAFNVNLKKNKLKWESSYSYMQMILSCPAVHFLTFLRNTVLIASPYIALMRKQKSACPHLAKQTKQKSSSNSEPWVEIYRERTWEWVKERKAEKRHKVTDSFTDTSFQSNENLEDRLHS